MELLNEISVFVSAFKVADIFIVITLLMGIINNLKENYLKLPEYERFLIKDGFVTGKSDLIILVCLVVILLILVFEADFDNKLFALGLAFIIIFNFLLNKPVYEILIFDNEIEINQIKYSRNEIEYIRINESQIAVKIINVSDIIIERKFLKKCKIQTTFLKAIQSFSDKNEVKIIKGKENQ